MTPKPQPPPTPTHISESSFTSHSQWTRKSQQSQRIPMPTTPLQTNNNNNNAVVSMVRFGSLPLTQLPDEDLGIPMGRTQPQQPEASRSTPALASRLLQAEEAANDAREQATWRTSTTTRLDELATRLDALASKEQKNADEAADKLDTMTQRLEKLERATKRAKHIAKHVSATVDALSIAHAKAEAIREAEKAAEVAPTQPDLTPFLDSVHAQFEDVIGRTESQLNRALQAMEQRLKDSVQEVKESIPPPAPPVPPAPAVPAVLPAPLAPISPPAHVFFPSANAPLPRTPLLRQSQSLAIQPSTTESRKRERKASASGATAALAAAARDLSSTIPRDSNPQTRHRKHKPSSSQRTNATAVTAFRQNLLRQFLEIQAQDAGQHQQQQSRRSKNK